MGEETLSDGTPSAKHLENKRLEEVSESRCVVEVLGQLILFSFSRRGTVSTSTSRENRSRLRVNDADIQKQLSAVFEVKNSNVWTLVVVVELMLAFQIAKVVDRVQKVDPGVLDGVMTTDCTRAAGAR